MCVQYTGFPLGLNSGFKSFDSSTAGIRPRNITYWGMNVKTQPCFYTSSSQYAFGMNLPN